MTFERCCEHTAVLNHFAFPNPSVLILLEGTVGMAQAALLFGAVIYVLESTSTRPISRFREREFYSPPRFGRQQW